MSGPFVTLQRQAWAALADATEIDLDEATLTRLRGIGDPTSTLDIDEVYRPLSQLLHLYMDQHRPLLRADQRLPRPRRAAHPVRDRGGRFGRRRQVDGVAPAAGAAARAPGNPKVDLVTTDGFLYPNAELERRGLLSRKGFPESYNRRALLEFVIDVKSGKSEVTAPVYSLLFYDIVPDEQIVVESPDILIVEGLNVLQPAKVEADGCPSLAVSDFFDFSVFVDADEDHIRQWFIERFLTLRQTAFTDERSYFRRYSELSEADAVRFGEQVWEEINGPNLRQNIAPTRDRATAILVEGPRVPHRRLDPDPQGLRHPRRVGRMTKGRDRNENRRDPFSEAFKTFIVSDWAPYPDALPERLPAAGPAAPAGRAGPRSSRTPRWSSLPVL